MNKTNKIFLSLIAFYPFVAYFAQSLFSLNVIILLFVIILIGIIFEILNNKNLQLPDTTILYYFIFIIYLTILDYFRGDLYGCGYYLIFTLPALYYFRSVKITIKFKNRLTKYFIFTVIISFIVIIIQQVYNSTFFVAPRWSDRLETDLSYVVRLPSIFTWISMTATLFTFPPLLGLVINEYINRKNLRLVILFTVIGFAFAILSRSRATLLYILIISLQVFFYSGSRLSRKIRNFILVIVMLFLSYNLLILIGIPVDKIVFFRFFEGGKEIESTTIYARVNNFNFFFDNIKEFWKFGVGNDPGYSLEMTMNRRSNAMLIGLLDPFFRYGIVAEILFLVFLYRITKQFYITAKLTSNWAPFLGIIGFIAMNFTANAYHLFQIGLLFLFAYDKYYREQYLEYRKFTLQKLKQSPSLV